MSADDCASIGASGDEQTCALGLVCNDHMCTVPPDGPRPECAADPDCADPKPHCAPDLTCVECVDSAHCPAASPVCEIGSHTCRGCALDAECVSRICDSTTGLCAPENTIAYASPGGSGTASCTRADPCSVQRAFAITDALRNIVLFAPGAYSGAISVSNKTVNVRGAGATLTSNAGNTLTVTDRGILRIRDLTVVNAATGGAGSTVIDCVSPNGIDIPEIDLMNVAVEGLNRGINMSHCKATITGSTLRTTGTSSTLGGIAGSTAKVTRTSILGGAYMIVATENSLLRLENCVIANPTSGDEAFVGIGGAVSVSFSTVLNARAVCTASAASCSGATTNGVCFENSIVVNLSPAAPADTITGQGCVATHTLVFPQATPIAGTGNKNGVNPNLKNPANNDLHLDTNSPAIDGANPASTVAEDFDGKARPQGAQRDLGAFEYP